MHGQSGPTIHLRASNGAAGKAPRVGQLPHVHMPEWKGVRGWAPRQPNAAPNVSPRFGERAARHHAVRRQQVLLHNHFQCRSGRRLAIGGRAGGIANAALLLIHARPNFSRGGEQNCARARGAW